MIIEIYLSKPVEPIGDCARFYIETNNQEFIQELKKYVCPVRLIKYLDQELENNEDILELVSLTEEQKVNLKIDLSLSSEKIINDPSLSPFPNKYLEQTKDYLDKYGNEPTLEESDLTQKSDRGYEIQLDNFLYKN